MGTRPTSAILPPAKRQFKQNSEEDWSSADRRHRKTISRVMDAIVGSVKCFLGALFENPKKGEMTKPALLLRENTSRQEDWIQYDGYTSDPIDIATSVTRPKRRDVRNRNVNKEEVVEMEEEEEDDEEFSSTEEDEPNVGKRLRRDRTRRRSRQRTNRASRNDFEHFDVFFME